jgi:outer membrane protein insertion porin family
MGTLQKIKDLILIENFLIPPTLIQELEQRVRIGFQRMGRNLDMMTRRIGLLLLAFSIFTGICSGAEETIFKITILGNAKVEEGTIRGAVKSREGGPFSVEKVREDLRSIFDLGYFTDVQVDIKSTPQGKEVIFIVVEKPSIKKIVVAGNQKVKYDDIKEKMSLKERTILNLEKVKDDSEQIRKLYFSKGYYGVKVEYKVDYLETNEAAVTFTISEGPKGHIQKIVFKGNNKIKSSELKKLMTTSQWNILSIITKSGILDEDVLKNDLQLLNAYYIDRGYLEAKVSGPKLDLSNPKKIGIEIEVAEGPQYRVGKIDFKGDVLTTKEALFKTIKLKRGAVFSNSAIRRDINALTEQFANQGYAYVEVNPETSADSKNLIVDLTFEIDKKKAVSYEKIQIVGNTKTRDKVIRRELQVAEGELYSASDMNRSRDRIKRLGFFKEVDFTTSRGSTEEKINFDIKVEEAPTGAISFGIGYSSVEKVVGTVSVSDRNLFGLGYRGVLRASLGELTQDFRLGFTDPYFLGYPLSAGIDLYHENVEVFTTYSYKILGGDLRFGKELTDKLRIDMVYKLENTNVYNVSLDASEAIQEQRGRTTTSALSITPSIDTRDDYYNPRRGSRSAIMIQNAGGPLGGDNCFVKVVADTSWFFPMPLNTTLNLRGRAGAILPYGGKVGVTVYQAQRDPITNAITFVPIRFQKDRLPIYEQFFVGGAQTIRGFEYGMAGPVDQNNDPVGANYMVVFNSELIFTLSREIGLKGAVFFDVGRAWGVSQPSSGINLVTGQVVRATPVHVKGIKFGAGPGIRWLSPFGPINIDIGFNLNPKKGEKGNVIDFNAGTVY